MRLDFVKKSVDSGFTGNFEFITRIGQEYRIKHWGCAYHHVTNDSFVGDGQFHLTVWSTVFTAEIHAIIWDALRKCLGEHCMYSNSRLELQALYSDMLRYTTISEVRDLVQSSAIENHMHWIKAHIGYVNVSVQILSSKSWHLPHC